MCHEAHQRATERISLACCALICASLLALVPGCNLTFSQEALELAGDTATTGDTAADASAADGIQDTTSQDTGSQQDLHLAETSVADTGVEDAQAHDMQPAPDTASADTAQQNDVVGSVACAGEADGTMEQVQSAYNPCLESCVNDSDFQGCSTLCLMTNGNISEGCATCYVDYYMCILGACETPCSTDEAACVSCIETSVCPQALTDCAGL